MTHAPIVGSFRDVANENLNEIAFILFTSLFRPKVADSMVNQATSSTFDDPTRLNLAEKAIKEPTSIVLSYFEWSAPVGFKVFPYSSFWFFSYWPHLTLSKLRQLTHFKAHLIFTYPTSLFTSFHLRGVLFYLNHSLFRC